MCSIIAGLSLPAKRFIVAFIYGFWIFVVSVKLFLLEVCPAWYKRHDHTCSVKTSTSSNKKNALIAQL
jgi:hypothetical protein